MHLLSTSVDQSTSNLNQHHPCYNGIHLAMTSNTTSRKKRKKPGFVVSGKRFDWLTDASAKTTPPSVSHAFPRPLTDGAVGTRRRAALAHVTHLRA
ncbi:unnamed protein product [Arctogadus glacialis]